MTAARDRLIAYAASTRTITADGLDGLIDDVIAEALTVGDPAALPVPTLEALIDVGNRALADYYHERACSCSTWPEACHSKLKAVLWETDAFAIALPALLGAWQEMQEPQDDLTRIITAAVPLVAAVSAELMSARFNYRADRIIVSSVTPGYAAMTFERAASVFGAEGWGHNPRFSDGVDNGRTATGLELTPPWLRVDCPCGRNGHPSA